MSNILSLLSKYDPREHIMIDLETLDIVPGGVILSIGACSFDLAKVFYMKINVQDSMAHRFTTKVSTMAWWAEQSAAARAEAFSGQDTVEYTLRSLTEFLHDISRKDSDHTLNIWGNGADFDVPMLNAAYDKLSIQRPWGHRDSRCFRTLKNLFSGVTEPVFSGEKHNALADAMHQARWADNIMTALYNSWHGLGEGAK